MLARLPAPGCIAALAVLAALTAGAPAPPAATATAAKTAGLPMRFEENRGQLDESARFVARQRGVDLVLTDDGGRLALPHDTSLALRVTGGRKVTPRASEPLETRSNYFVGADPSKWRTDVPNFGRVVYPSVLEGVDLVYHGEEGQLEYDFVVAPGANAGAIAVEVEGASGVSLTADGDLAIETAHGTLVQRRPRVYQRDATGREHDVAASYRLVGATSIGFEVAAYDRARDLVIDPVLSYSSYLGGSGADGAADVAVDAAGSAYLTGETASTNFPTKGAFQAANGTGLDVFVAKLNPGGTALVYATYVGGDGTDSGTAIAINATGEAFVVGFTESTDFPLKNAAQGGTSGNRDAFVLKLAPSGAALGFSTYLGGSGADTALNVAVGKDGNAYVTGSTSSVDFPTQGTPLQPDNAGGANDAFFAKVSTAGALPYATYLGGTGDDIATAIAVDATGSAYIVGRTDSADFPTMTPQQANNAGAEDGFIARIDPTGTALVYATYLGGSGSDSPAAVAVDAASSVYIAGSTTSTDFPNVAAFKTASAGGTDAFVTKLNAAGAVIVYSTYFGGGGDDSATGIAVDPAGNAVISGSTTSTNLPLQKFFQGASGGGMDGFVARLVSTGSALDFATYLGGNAADQANAVAIDAKGTAYVAGSTSSGNFPKQGAIAATNAGSSDAFLTKLGNPPLTLTPATVRVIPNGTQPFTAAGGSGFGYRFDIQTNMSGASIVASTGVYTAGAKIGAVDVVRVVDSVGVTTTSTVTIDPGGVGAPDAGAEAGVPEAGIDKRIGETPPRLEIQTIDDSGCTAAAGTTPAAPLAVLAGAVLAGLGLAARRRRRD